MRVTEDRTTAAATRRDQDARTARPPWTGVDERAVRWVMLGSLLVGVHAIVVVLLSVWLAP